MDRVIRRGEALLDPKFGFTYSYGRRAWFWRGERPYITERTMESRISVVTLGVNDLGRSRAFYERLGWQASSASQGDVVFFRGQGVVLALYPRTALAEDATVGPGGSGFRGITLAYNVRGKDEVAKALEDAKTAGGQVIKPAQDVFWGGHSGYFADPDGHLWEVAWNPHFDLGPSGEVQLP
jgi:catechol 2,3-dioxygenase-like lactoylglutathione lyase family enzyme